MILTLPNRAVRVFPAPVSSAPVAYVIGGFEGAEETERLSEMLETLDLPEPDRGICQERMQRQLENAREWRDVINTFFHRLSGEEDAHGRTIWP